MVEGKMKRHMDFGGCAFPFSKEDKVIVGPSPKPVQVPFRVTNYIIVIRTNYMIF